MSMKADDFQDVVIDFYCGGGGSTNGMLDEFARRGYRTRMIAINHWQVAITTHSKNHPDIEHICDSVDQINPLKVVPHRQVFLAWASPECTHHSNARGGKPRNDQKRADAWQLMRWIEKLNVKNLILENVKEFRDWGPLTAKGKPDKRYKGLYYQQFLAWLRVNYNVQERVLNAADYGDPQTRERLFIIARRPKHMKIRWPQPTHAKRPYTTAKGTTLKTWVAARTIIDWSIPAHSIFLTKEEGRAFGCKRPLVPATLNRIFMGLNKFCGLPFTIGVGGPRGSQSARNLNQPSRTVMPIGHQGLAEPYLVVMRNNMAGRGLGEALPTLTAVEDLGLAQPFLTILRTHANSRALQEPAPTLCAQGNHLGLSQPSLYPLTDEQKNYLLNCAHTASDQRRIYPLEEPIRTVTGDHGTFGLISLSRFLVKYYEGSDAVSIDEACPSVTANFEHLALAQPFLISNRGGGDGYLRGVSTESPIGAITAEDPHSLIEPHLIGFHGNHPGQDDGSKRVHSLEDPLKAVDTSNRFGLVQPACIVKFYGTSIGQGIDEALHTVTGKDRFGLVVGLWIPHLNMILDIRFRMLRYHELAAAQSFPRDYYFFGTDAQKKRQIGNAVPRRLARALTSTIF